MSSHLATLRAARPRATPQTEEHRRLLERARALGFPALRDAEGWILGTGEACWQRHLLRPDARLREALNNYTPPAESPLPPEPRTALEPTEDPGPAPSTEVLQARAAALGWPSLRLAPWDLLCPGPEAWTRFLAAANPTDLSRAARALAALSQGD